MKRIPCLSIALLFVFCFTITASAQRPAPEFDRHHRNVYIELLGSSVLTGVHYDQRFKRGQMNGLGFRAGVGGLSVRGTGDNGEEVSFGMAVFPMEVNVTTGRRRSGFVAGAGLLPAYATGSVRETNGNGNFAAVEGVGLLGGFLNLGYRLQPLRSGLFLQFSYNPMILRGSGYNQWFGLSLGVGFK